MFTSALIAVAIVTVVARLVTAVRNDRPSSPPRSHAHEIDPQAMRMRPVI